MIEYRLLKNLNTPQKIQNFLDTMPFNFEENGLTNLSPMAVLEKKVCHCLEGAALAALALRIQGKQPLLLDLRAAADDWDHVIALFRIKGYWGAISKTNHNVLRYREPVYQSIRELAMTFFHEYYDPQGKKTLRSFSSPVNLKVFDKYNWMTTKRDIDYLWQHLDKVKHYPILSKKQIRHLRRADKIEIKSGELVEWKKSKTKKS